MEKTCDLRLSAHVDNIEVPLNPDTVETWIQAQRKEHFGKADIATALELCALQLVGYCAGAPEMTGWFAIAWLAGSALCNSWHVTIIRKKLSTLLARDWLADQIARHSFANR